jgi:hypothetical protein
MYPFLWFKTENKFSIAWGATWEYSGVYLKSAKQTTSQQEV